MHCSRCFHTTPLEFSSDATFCPEVEAEDYACFDRIRKTGNGYGAMGINQKLSVGCVRVMWMAEWSGQ